MRSFTAYIEWDPETNLYVGTVPGVCGAHSQGATLEELQANLREVIELCLEEAVCPEEPASPPDLGPHFLGVRQIDVPE
jgi:predicted RNase H-like HicB family nuclease